MLRRYELTDEEWNRIVDLLPPENTGKQGRPKNVIVQSLMKLSGLPAMAHPGETCQNVMPPGKRFTAVSVNGLKMVFWTISFMS